MLSGTVRRFGIREIASERQKVESKRPSRATVLPGEETPRGKEHGGNAGKREGM